MSRRRGFTVIEMLIVIIVIGTLALLSILRYRDLRNHAVASGVATELNGIRLAAYNHWADHESFPADEDPGVVPPALEPYLTAGFEFARPQHVFDWEHFSDSDGGITVGVVVTSNDDQLMAILARRQTGGLPYFVVGNTLTYVIVGPDGAM